MTKNKREGDRDKSCQGKRISRWKYLLSGEAAWSEHSEDEGLPGQEGNEAGDETELLLVRQQTREKGIGGRGRVGEAEGLHEGGEGWTLLGSP